MIVHWKEGRLHVINPTSGKLTKYTIGFCRYDMVAKGAHQTYTYGVLNSVCGKKNTEKEAVTAVHERLNLLGISVTYHKEKKK